MKKYASPFRRLFLTKNFIMMLVMLVVIIVTVSAWFTVHKTVSADTMRVQAESTEIDIAPCVKTYDSSYNVLTDGPGEFGGSLTFSAPEDFGSFTKDCTGDGKDLIVPDFNVTNDYDNVRRTTGKDVNINVTGRHAVSQEFSRIESLKHPDQDPPEYQYMEFEFYVRSKNRTLQLGEDSELRAESELNGGSLSATLATGSDKRSAYGNFNVDGLVGAIRVALVGEACNEVTQQWQQDTETAGRVSYTNVTDKSDPAKQILWYPRPDVFLSIPETAGDITNWSLITGLTGNTYGTFQNSYYYNNGNGLTKVDNDTDPKTYISPGVSSGIPKLGVKKTISDFSEVNYEPEKVDLTIDKNHYRETEQYYLTKYTLKVWIEGTDSEARRAMDGGKFNLTLKFM